MKKKIFFIITLIFIFFFFFFCFFDFHSNKKIYNVDTDRLPFSQNEIYHQLFDLNNIVSVKVDISNEEMKKLQKDFENNKKSPIYRMANLTISITLPNKKIYNYYIEEVGIKLKGNVSKIDFYNEDYGIINLNHFKFNFRETFDDKEKGYLPGEYHVDKNGKSTLNKYQRDKRSKRLFGNMKKISVKWNKNLDTTYIREYYAYELFRSEGIVVPHIGLATMDINVNDKKENSAYLGVFSINEVVDSKFIKNNILDKTNDYSLNKKNDYMYGNLYKAKWDGKDDKWFGANLTNNCTYGIANDMKKINYNYELKTNKLKPNYNSLKNLLDGLNNINSKSDLEKYIDIDYFIKFAAVSYAVGNPDDMRNNYNNYYLYFYKDKTNKKNNIQKVMIIPYDYDRSFGITIDLNSDNAAMTSVSPFSTEAINVGEQENPLYKYTVCEGGYYVEEYKKELKNILNNKLFTFEEFKKYYNLAKKNYSNKVTPSNDFNNLIGLSITKQVNANSFYFTLDTTNDEIYINTPSVTELNQNLLIEEYFKRIRSMIEKSIE